MKYLLTILINKLQPIICPALWCNPSVHNSSPFVFLLPGFVFAINTFELQKLLEEVLKSLLVCHSGRCDYRCSDFKDSISSFMELSLCPAIPSLSISGSHFNFYSWKCISLQCDNCWRNKAFHLLNFPEGNWDSDTGILC